MTLNVNLPNCFPHQPPQNYSYETERNGKLVTIYICNHSDFTYTDNHPVKCYWGSYCEKSQQYYASNATSLKVDKVDIKRTTPYSAVNRLLNPLEMAFL